MKEKTGEDEAIEACDPADWLLHYYSMPSAGTWGSATFHIMTAMVRSGPQLPRAEGLRCRRAAPPQATCERCCHCCLWAGPAGTANACPLRGASLLQVGAGVLAMPQALCALGKLNAPPPALAARAQQCRPAPCAATGGQLSTQSAPGKPPHALPACRLDRRPALCVCLLRSQPARILAPRRPVRGGWGAIPSLL